MTNIKLSSNAPWLFYSIVVACLLFLFSLWLFLHPNSPWHSRDNYLVAFKEIGDLKVGNAVNVGGLKKGYVKHLELTDSCVWVTIAVLANVKIPVDSKLKVVNVGLMGERAVDISLGSSENYHEKETQIIGFFDMSSTEVGVLAFDILNDAKTLINVVSDFSDSLFSKENVDKFKKIDKKGKILIGNLSRVTSSAENSLNALLDSLVIAKDKTGEIIDNIKVDFDGIIKNMDLAMKNFNKLEESLIDLKVRIEIIARELNDGDNTISLSLSKQKANALKQDMETISEDAKALMKKISAKGLDLNVDIF